MPMFHADVDKVVLSPEFRQYLAETLLELCAIDTTPRSDLRQFADAERRVFDAIEARLKCLDLPGLTLSRVPINPDIQQHAFYSRPYHTITSDHPQEKSAGETYAGRCNLVVTLDGTAGNTGGLALDAHIDVVKPYIAPRREGNILFGRGACDDKGPLVSIVGAVRLVSQHLKRAGRRLTKPLTLMFVIEEEMGGNGSLSLAMDLSLRSRYDTQVVLECCSSNIYPANRGAVWYKVEACIDGVNLFETAAFIIEEMEREGRAIRAESRHELFPHRPAQTCHGILGNFGEHPSRICGRVDFLIQPADSATNLASALPLIHDILDDGLAQYIAVYGDKTKTIDPATGKPKVARHYEVETMARELVVRVHGASGHMGAILQNDGAITKMASMMRALVTSRDAIERAAGGRARFTLHNWPDASHLLMEGGQGFLPTHPMSQIMDRLRQAVWRGVRRHLALVGRPDIDPTSAFAVTFDKLHNASFAGDPHSPAMQSAISAAKAAGIWKDDQAIRGWDVSCDARIFACEYPDLTVLTTGPGHLIHAHADDEQIDLDELSCFTGFLSRFILDQTL
ncbi:MAG: M20/M25/M40 family metallo-hydrolase [Tepidisphaerales bacterium]